MGQMDDILGKYLVTSKQFLVIRFRHLDHVMQSLTNTSTIFMQSQDLHYIYINERSLSLTFHGCGHYHQRTPVQVANIGSICSKASKVHIPKIIRRHLTLVNKIF